jgi:hypothetical protein
MNYKKLGFIIGLVSVVVWTLVFMWGTMNCQWNPVEGSVIPDGVCKNTFVVFYFPIYFLGGWFFIFFPVLGFIIGWIVDKVKSK